MSISKKIKTFIGKYYLSKELKDFRRDRKVSNFETARSFILLFDASEEEQFELVKKYVKYLKEGRKKVKAIGYFDAKDLPVFEYVKLDYDFISNKNLNWYGKPSNSESNFINDEYDVLINFSLKDSFPLYYLSALSKAKFKIGKAVSESDAYDMAIEQPGDKNFKFFMRQVDHYLGIIDKRTEQ